jgi:pyruvate dehydrogenase E2 component (dihydrolipoamide acetyltransferase)
MPTNILMPALSPTMTEGTLARWLKKEGEQIRAGDVIAEIETDKATMEVEAVDEGVLSRILVADGTAGVKVNDPIAVLQGEGEDAAAPAPAAPAPTPVAPAASASAAAPAMPAPAMPAPATAAPPSPAPAAVAPAANGHDAGHGADRVFASPLARRMAKQAGMDLSAMKGSGPNGRIIRADIEAKQAGSAGAPAAHAAPPAPVMPAAERVEAQAGGRETDAIQAVPVQQVKPAAPAPSAIPASAIPAPAKAAPVTAPHQLVPNSAMRKVIARRLLESHQQVPNFFVTMDIEIDALLKLRADLNARAPKEGKGAFKLSVNDLVIKAAAVTLRRVPKMNASYTDDSMVVYDDVDISIAVSMPDGLITPIVRKADQKGLAAISGEMRDLGARAKAGKLRPEEFQGGTFSISNLGMFGVKHFTAIINPPQAAILAVGAGEPRPVVRNGALAIANVMTCTLSVDHRVADGALGAEWMQVFKGIIEDPLSLML